MMLQRALLFKRVKVTEATRTFFTQQLSSNEELCTQLEWVESDLATTQKAVTNGAKLPNETKKEREVANVDLCQMKEEREATEAKCKDAE